MNIGKKDFIWSYIGTTLNVITGIVLLPLVLHYLNGDELGLWYIFVSIGTLISLLDFGFTQTIARNIAYIWSGANRLNSTSTSGIDVREEIDVDLLATVIRTCKVIYSIISAVALVLMIVPGTVYLWVVSADSDSMFWLESWLVYAVAIFLNLFYLYYNACLRGVGNVEGSAKAMTFSKMANLALSVLLLVFGFGLLGVSLGYLLSVVLYRILSRVFFERSKEVKKIIVQFPAHIALGQVRETFMTIWHNTWRDGLVALSSFLGTQVNTLICSMVLGLTSTGFYGLAMQLAGVITSVSCVWYSTVQPKLQECAVKGHRDAFSKLFSEAVSVYFLASALLTVISALVCPPLVGWLRPEMDFDVPMYLGVCLYMISFQGNLLFTSGISNFNMIPHAKAYIVSGIFSAFISYLLASFTPLGIWSVIIAPFLALYAYNGWKWPHLLLGLLHIQPMALFSQGAEGLYEKVHARLSKQR